MKKKNFGHPIATLFYCQDSLSPAYPGRIDQRDHWSIDLWEDSWETVLNRLKNSKPTFKNHPVRLEYVTWHSPTTWHGYTMIPCKDDWDDTILQIRKILDHLG